MADHLRGKDPAVRRLYRQLASTVMGFGPVTVYAQKTRIVFQVRVRFAGALLRQRWLECAFWLKRRAEHPLIYRVEKLLARDHIHYFRLARPEDLDDEMVALLREAYAVGRQECG